MKAEVPAEIHVLSDRDVGRIMAMLETIVMAINELFDARKAPFEEPESLADHERIIDEIEARRFEDDPLF